MLRIGVLVSGGGTNLQAIIDKIESGYLDNCRIESVVSSKEDAFALIRAEKYKIPSKCILKKNFKNSNEYDNELIKHFKELNVDLIVLAGFLTILGEDFVNAFKYRIINVHPSLIPSFCGKGFYGLKPHIAALEYGVKVSGATVHFVVNEADAGPIILQKAVYVNENDTPALLQKRIMEQAEWEILPEAIKLYSEGKITVVNGKTVIDYDK